MSMFSIRVENFDPTKDSNTHPYYTNERYKSIEEANLGQLIELYFTGKLDLPEARKAEEFLVQLERQLQPGLTDEEIYAILDKTGEEIRG